MGSTLVMLQTNSNQPFIFSSPRLREQIGASFKITLLSQWVKEAACDMKLPSMSTSEEGKKALPASFWVSDSSGKVIVRFTESDGDPENLARQLIREVTLRALTDAPASTSRESSSRRHPTRLMRVTSTRLIACSWSTR